MFTSISPRCSNQEINDVVSVLRKGWLAPGENASILEKETSRKCGKKSGVLVNSKASALLISFLSAGIHQGVHVLTPALTDTSIIAILKQIGAIIDFYDVSLDNFTLTPEELPNLITKEINYVIISNPLGTHYDYSAIKQSKSIVIIEDLYFSLVENPSTDISILTFDQICSIALFANDQTAESALCMRDWGRVGTQNEDINARYDNYTLDGVKYDYKFVYGHLGFNFKSCEMSATLALRRFENCKEKVTDFQNLKSDFPDQEKSKSILISENGYCMLVKREQNKDEIAARLSAIQVSAHTMFSSDLVLADGEQFKNAKDLFDNYMFVYHTFDFTKNKLAFSVVLE